MRETPPSLYQDGLTSSQLKDSSKHHWPAQEQAFLKRSAGNMAKIGYNENLVLGQRGSAYTLFWSFSRFPKDKLTLLLGPVSTSQKNQN